MLDSTEDESEPAGAAEPVADSAAAADTPGPSTPTCTSFSVPDAPTTPPGADLPPDSFSPGVPSDTSISALHSALYSEARMPSTALAALSLSATEMPQRPRRNRWELDEDVLECRMCSRRFTFFLRRHHCRRADELVFDPETPEMAAIESEGLSRVCNECARGHQEPNSSLFSSVFGIVERVRQRIVSGESSAASVLSEQASELDECPVCEATLESLSAAEREEHVQQCFEQGVPNVLKNTRYIVSALASNSPLLGAECIICMEDFDAGAEIAHGN
ncbi:hypothetical protein MCUN1_000453 [Malassezia cuniculi]|uniref:FYVE-type domain-containing protein n=1 Tax=Malassezia cuniculi TaxID=948313 RepID=A0AAF0EP09_9BASI|nr:hypothetical protein MCUN1_000453 [Malassezia cuniculi]